MIVRNLVLAAACNEAAGWKVDPLQLEAAVYMHDVGMMYLPEELWLKQGKLSAEERLQLAAHPGWAADMLMRMKGWEEAASIVRDHHERIDGTGYPAGKPAGLIMEGAKLLALAAGAVGLSTGRIFQSGALVASVAQEGMVRLPEGAAARRARVRGTAQRMALRTVLRRSWRR